jgi:hypothetical protein
MNLVEKLQQTRLVVDHLKAKGHEVLRINVDVFSKPTIEIAPLPICEEMPSTLTIERLDDGRLKHSRIALVGLCRVEWRQ